MSHLETPVLEDASMTVDAIKANLKASLGEALQRPASTRFGELVTPELRDSIKEQISGYIKELCNLKRNMPKVLSVGPVTSAVGRSVRYKPSVCILVIYMSDGSERTLKFRSARTAKVYYKRVIRGQVYANMHIQPVQPLEYITLNLLVDKPIQSSMGVDVPSTDDLTAPVDVCYTYGWDTSNCEDTSNESEKQGESSTEASSSSEAASG